MQPSIFRSAASTGVTGSIALSAQGEQRCAQHACYVSVSVPDPAALNEA
jgi:hypothetical protein